MRERRRGEKRTRESGALPNSLGKNNEQKMVLQGCKTASFEDHFNWWLLFFAQITIAFSCCNGPFMYRRAAPPAARQAAAFVRL